MADTEFAPASPCVQCRLKAEIWVSHNGGTDWYQIPNVYAWRKTVTRTTGQSVVIDGVSSTPCTATAKSYQYQFDAWECDAAPLEAFLLDNDSVQVRAVKGDGGSDAAASATVPYHEFSATYDDDGEAIDTQSQTPHSRTSLLNVTSAITRKGFTVPASHPHSNAEVNNAA